MRLSFAVRVRRLVAVAAVLGALLSGPVGDIARAQAPAPDAAQRAATELPETIPLFPLPDVVFFPDVSLPLRIFEPRYRAMVADALEGNRIIGMVLLQPGHEAEYEGRPPIFSVGAAGVITQEERLDNGEYTLVLRGLQKFRVLREEPGGAYRVAHVAPLPESPPDALQTSAVVAERERVRAVLTTLADRLGIDPASLMLRSDVGLVIGLAQVLELAPPEWQALLELDGPLARLRSLADQLEALTRQ